MSRAYRISVSESRRRIVHIADGVATQLEILPILERERTRQLLAEELARRGFEIDGDRARRNAGDDESITVEVELDSGRVAVRQSAEHALERRGQRSRQSELEVDDALSDTLRAELGTELGRELDDEERQLREAATERLSGHLRELQAELDAVAHAVAVTALDERARQLGDVEERSEGEDGSLTIRIRV